MARSLKTRHIPFHHDEWLQGCARLDNATRGMYITACALIYSLGGPISEEDLRIATRDHGNAFRRQLGKLISEGKLLTESDGKMTNKRCENELEMARIRSENAADSAANRWKRNETPDANAMLAQQSNGNANHNHNHNHNQEYPLNPPNGGLAKRGNGHATRSSGDNPRKAKWRHLDGLSDRDLGARANALKGPQHYDERREIKRRLGFYVPPD